MSLFLRDQIEHMMNKRIKNESDFEWRKNFRCYIQDGREHFDRFVKEPWKD